MAWLLGVPLLCSTASLDAPHLGSYPCGRAVLGTVVFSGLSPAQGCPVCEDARTPSPVLPITCHLKGLAFCLGSCKELAQLRFSHTGEECRKRLFFFFFPSIQSTQALRNSGIKAPSISVEIDCRVSAACGNLGFTGADLHHFKGVLRGPSFYFFLASHPWDVFGGS